MCLISFFIIVFHSGSLSVHERKLFYSKILQQNNHCTATICSDVLCILAIYWTHFSCFNHTCFIALLRLKRYLVMLMMQYIKSCSLPNMAFLICVNIFWMLLSIVYYICMYIYSLLFFPARL